jgi:hypothetical protein
MAKIQIPVKGVLEAIGSARAVRYILNIKGL